MRSRPLRVRGVRPHNSPELLLVHRPPCGGIHLPRIEQRVEGPVAVLRARRFQGQQALAGIAAEDPAVESDSGVGSAFDGVAGDAACGVDPRVRA